MKSTYLNLPRNIFVAAAILFLASRCFSLFGQASAENDDRFARPEFYYIQGEVKVPQRYVYTNGLTLTAAIKRAKGMTAVASSTNVSLIRIGQKPVVINCRAIEEGKAKDIELKPGDKVSVPRK